MLFILGTVLLAFLAAGVILATAMVTGVSVSLPPFWPAQTRTPIATGFAVALGVALILGVPPVARAVALGDGLVAVALLGRAPSDELAEQVVHLAQTRTDTCLLYTFDAADERYSVDLGGRRIIKKKRKKNKHRER